MEDKNISCPKDSSSKPNIPLSYDFGCTILLIIVFLAGIIVYLLYDRFVPPIKESRTEIVRVFNEGSFYSVMIENPDTHEITKKYCDSNLTKIFTNLSPSEKMYLRTYSNPKYPSTPLYDIHIHSAQELDGGTTQGKTPQKITPINP